LDREKTVYTELSIIQNSTHYQSSKTALIINHPNIAAALTTSSHPFILSSLT